METNEMKAVNALRILSVDMIQKANSGHPGVAIDAAPMAFALWEKVMHFNPNYANWINRDRFVLSAGHGSSLLYSLLYFNGFGLTIKDLENFRQLGSKTPGHPEVGHTAGVDATTGPLSQGIATAVGMALAEKHLAAIYNKPGFPVIDHYTYSLIGDGDLMEGLSEEALNIAGDKQLSKLIVLYDSNDVSLDGPLSLSTDEDVKARVEAAGWDYRLVVDGNTDIDAITAAIRAAQHTNRPSLIEIKTTIGYGAPKQGTNAVHGAALGEDGVRKLREFFDWHQEPFEFDAEVTDVFTKAVEDKRVVYDQWAKMFAKYSATYPSEAAQLTNAQLDMTAVSNDYQVGDEIATRVASQNIMNQIAKTNPQFWGGAADLASSNKTLLKDQGVFTPDDPAGNNIFFGVREFGMATAINGINLHGGSRAFGSTFFVFSDYMRAAVRLAAIMNLPSIFIGSHDSIAVGEDGPTHEPIEQLTSFRAMPNLNLIRPADANETLAGSEVALALAAQKLLLEEEIDVRVVSMPVMNLFEEQSAEYKEAILPASITKRLAVEMGASLSWGRYVGLNGKVMGIDTFGASGKGPEVIEHFSFTPTKVAETFKEL